MKKIKHYLLDKNYPKFVNETFRNIRNYSWNIDRGHENSDYSLKNGPEVIISGRQHQNNRNIDLRINVTTGYPEAGNLKLIKIETAAPSSNDVFKNNGSVHVTEVTTTKSNSTASSQMTASSSQQQDGKGTATESQASSDKKLDPQQIVSADQKMDKVSPANSLMGAKTESRRSRWKKRTNGADNSYLNETINLTKVLVNRILDEEDSRENVVSLISGNYTKYDASDHDKLTRKNMLQQLCLYTPVKSLISAKGRSLFEVHAPPPHIRQY